VIKTIKNTSVAELRELEEQKELKKEVIRSILEAIEEITEQLELAEKRISELEKRGE